MKKCVVLLVFFILAASSSLPVLQAQSGSDPSFKLNGLVLTFSSIAQGRVTLDDFTTLFNIEGDAIQRILVNKSTGFYVGYNLKVERLGDSAKLKIVIAPLLQSEIERVRGKNIAANLPNNQAYNPTPLPRYPEPQIIDITEAVELNLWINPETGANISDLIRFELEKPVPARDFKLDDVILKLTEFRLLINGEVRSGDRDFRGISGALPWFYLPGKGRFILSIQPHEGYDFQRIGVIENNKISFVYGSDKYEWIARQPVLNHRGKWHLWVMHDDKFQSSKEALDDLNLLSKGNCCLYGALSKTSLITAH